MKAINKALALSAFAAMALSSCTGDREPIIYEGVLPIRTSTMYVVGDAAPCGWKEKSRTPLEADPENIYRFTYDGPLMVGELKFSLIAESWSDPFIRPAEPALKVGTEPIIDAEFVYWAGNPDDKWNIIEAGIYHVEFNLKNWTYCMEYKGEIPIEPYEAQNVFPIGDAVLGIGWDLTKTQSLPQISTYVWEGEVKLRAGYEVKFLTERDWYKPQIRPYQGGMPWTKDGLSDLKVTNAKAPDNKWMVQDAGTYKVNINLEKWRINVTYLGE